MNISDKGLDLIRKFEGYKKPHSNRPVWEAVVHYLRTKDGNDCGICGKELTTKIQIDHILPMSVGGANRLDNFRLVHGHCNVSHFRKNYKSAKPKPRSAESRKRMSEITKNLWAEMRSGIRPMRKRDYSDLKIAQKRWWAMASKEEKMERSRKIWESRRANANANK